MKKKSVNLITAVGVLVVLSGAYVGVKAYVAKQVPRILKVRRKKIRKLFP